MTDKNNWHEFNETSKMEVNSVEVLSCININAQASVMAINNLICHVSNEKFKQLLSEQITVYEEIINKAKKLAAEFNTELLGANNLSKIVSIANTKIQLLAGCSTSNIAEILIVFTTQRIIDLGKTLRHTPDVDEKITKLGGQLIIYEEAKVELLKNYL